MGAIVIDFRQYRETRTLQSPKATKRKPPKKRKEPWHVETACWCLGWVKGRPELGVGRGEIGFLFDVAMLKSEPTEAQADRLLAIERRVEAAIEREEENESGPPNNAA